MEVDEDERSSIEGIFFFGGNGRATRVGSCGGAAAEGAAVTAEEDATEGGAVPDGEEEDEGGITACDACSCFGSSKITSVWMKKGMSYEKLLSQL